MSKLEYCTSGNRIMGSSYLCTEGPCTYWDLKYSKCRSWPISNLLQVSEGKMTHKQCKSLTHHVTWHTSAFSMIQSLPPIALSPLDLTVRGTTQIVQRYLLIVNCHIFPSSSSELQLTRGSQVATSWMHTRRQKFSAYGTAACCPTYMSITHSNTHYEPDTMQGWW